jgi:mannosyltransferase
MKKIIYDGIISSLQSYGGVTVYFKEIIQRMAPDDYTLIEYSRAKNRLSLNSVERKYRFLERYRDCYLEQLPGDIFHSTYYRLPNKKIPIVTTVHDFTYEKYVSGIPKHVHVWQKHRAIKKSDKIICVSNNTANDLMQYCRVDERKITVIYNGVSDNYFKINDNGIRTNKVIFIGARAGYKNFDKAVHAISMSKDLELVIVGGGVLNKAEALLLEHKLKGRYSFLGKISDSELNKLYNKAYCLLYPSEYEGFGIPILEAMKAGCPVIAVNRSSIPEIAGKAALLVDSSAEGVLYEALVDIRLKRDIYTANGVERSSIFSWDRCFEETERLYSEF